MTSMLQRWNLLSAKDAVDEILPCCGSRAWARALVSRRPIDEESSLLAASDEIWSVLPEEAWREAFCSHPRIGESRRKQPDMEPLPTEEARKSYEVVNLASTWSDQEQRGVTIAGASEKVALAEANRIYEQRFGRIFIICADGKSTQDILSNLDRRLRNDAVTELHEAAEQQRVIANLRLKKWLQG